MRFVSQPFDVNRLIFVLPFLQITSARVSLNGLDLSLIEVGSGSLCVPPGLFLVFMTCKSKHSAAREDLMPFFDLLFFQKGESGDQVQVLWSCFFNKSSPQNVSCGESNIHVFRNATQGVDYESNISEAKALFHRLFPEDDFLPRAPDAEDIVIEERDEQTKSEPE